MRFQIDIYTIFSGLLVKKKSFKSSDRIEKFFVQIVPYLYSSKASLTIDYREIAERLTQPRNALYFFFFLKENSNKPLTRL